LRRQTSIIGCSIVAVALLGWWLFGWSNYEAGGLRSVSHRSFGRVTRIELSSDEDPGRTRVLFRWSQPYRPGDPVDCTGAPPEVWRDDDGDGRWDVWIKRVKSEKDNCINEYSVDVTGDGVRDVSFRLPWSQSKEAETKINALRGARQSRT
jgi:hypothetical protein